MKNTIFEGSGVAIVTPFSEDGSINFDVFDELIEFQIENGTNCIIVCGTTGESPALSDEEHTQAVEFTVKKVNGRIPVIAGAGSNNTKHAIELSQKVEKLGVNGILSVTPYYNKTSQAGLIEHFTKIADSVNIPIILYNVPSRTGYNILPETYATLAKHKNICAIKEANSNMASMVKTLALCGNEIDIYSGEDALIQPSMALGAKGVISVFANVCPKQCHELTHAMLNSDYSTALNIQLKFDDLISALFSDVNPIPVKEALNLMGYNCGKCRLPLVDMNNEKRDLLLEILKKHSLIK